MGLRRLGVALLHCCWVACRKHRERRCPHRRKKRLARVDGPCKLALCDAQGIDEALDPEGTRLRKLDSGSGGALGVARQNPENLGLGALRTGLRVPGNPETLSCSGPLDGPPFGLRRQLALFGQGHDVPIRLLAPPPNPTPSRFRSKLSGFWGAEAGDGLLQGSSPTRFTRLSRCICSQLCLLLVVAIRVAT